MKIEEMADVFLNSANFVSHAFLTLVPPSGYALNLNTLTKVSKVSWTSQFSYEILRSSFERKFDKTNFISPKKHFAKARIFRIKWNNILVNMFIRPCTCIWNTRVEDFYFLFYERFNGKKIILNASFTFPRKHNMSKICQWGQVSKVRIQKRSSSNLKIYMAWAAGTKYKPVQAH